MFKKLGLFLVCFFLPLASQFLHPQVQGAPTQPAFNPPWVIPDKSALPDPPARVELWDKLSLQGSDLHADPPVVEQTDDFPEFSRELVRMKWRDGDPIDLYVVRPIGVAMPPVIVYLYGYPREAVRFLDRGFCTTVTKGGYAAIGFSSMLTGQRYHDVPMKEWFVSDLPHSLVGTTHDVQKVLDYLESRGDFDMTRVGIFGEGSGGTIALLAASTDPRIKAVDALNPWGDWSSWFSESSVVPDSERADYLKEDFLRSVAPLDPTAVLPKLTSTPVRLQQNLWAPSEVPETSRDRIAAALPVQATLSRYKDVQDYYDKVGSNGRMLDWIYASLPAPPERASNHLSTLDDHPVKSN